MKEKGSLLGSLFVELLLIVDDFNFCVFDIRCACLLRAGTCRSLCLSAPFRELFADFLHLFLQVRGFCLDERHILPFERFFDGVDGGLDVGRYVAWQLIFVLIESLLCAEGESIGFIARINSFLADGVFSSMELSLFDFSLDFRI